MSRRHRHRESDGSARRVASIKVGAQNMHWEPNGAFTGEISTASLRDCARALRHPAVTKDRRLCLVNRQNCESQVRAHEATLRPIVCVGETWSTRQGQPEKILSLQLRGSLKDLAKKIQRQLSPTSHLGDRHRPECDAATSAGATRSFGRRRAEISDETTADRHPNSIRRQRETGERSRFERNRTSTARCRRGVSIRAASRKSSKAARGGSNSLSDRGLKR